MLIQYNSDHPPKQRRTSKQHTKEGEGVSEQPQEKGVTVVAETQQEEQMQETHKQEEVEEKWRSSCGRKCW